MNIINLLDFKKKKKLDDEMARGRTPLYVSHLTGKISGSPSENEDFGSRLQRIRTSLDKINRLMAELKQMNQEASNDVRQH